MHTHDIAADLDIGTPPLVVWVAAHPVAVGDVYLFPVVVTRPSPLGDKWWVVLRSLVTHVTVVRTAFPLWLWLVVAGLAPFPVNAPPDENDALSVSDTATQQPLVKRIALPKPKTAYCLWP